MLHTLGLCLNAHCDVTPYVSALIRLRFAVMWKIASFSNYLRVAWFFLFIAVIAKSCRDCMYNASVLLKSQLRCAAQTLAPVYKHVIIAVTKVSATSELLSRKRSFGTLHLTIGRRRIGQEASIFITFITAQWNSLLHISQLRGSWGQSTGTVMIQHPWVKG